MATEAAVAKRRAEAESGIEKSVSALAENYGIEPGDRTVSGVRDLELRRVMQLEKLAAVLAEIVTAARSYSAADNDFPEDFPARTKLINLGVSYGEIKTLSREKLIELDGIAEKTADDILSYESRRHKSRKKE